MCWWWAARRWPRLLVITVVVALATGGCGGRGEASPAPRRHATPARVSAVVPARETGSPVTQVPRAVRLPSGSWVRIQAVATRANGVLDVPADIREAGWWRGGARIGDLFGVTLLAGHVDSRTQGLGAFVALLGLRSGQPLVVTTRGLRQHFTVARLRLIPQGDLTLRTWLYRASGARRLVLVTCAPPYDPATGYQQLAVVVAVPDGPAEARPT